MKSIMFLFITAIMFCGCSQPPKDRFSVTVTTNDSLILFDGQPIARIQDEIEEVSYVMSTLSDTLDKLKQEMVDSAEHSNKNFYGRLFVEMPPQLSYKLVFKIIFSSQFAHFGEIRLRGTLKNGSRIEIPVISDQGIGLLHRIIITPKGALLSVSNRWAPPAECRASLNNESAGSTFEVIAPGENEGWSPSIFVPVSDDLKELKEELDWIQYELMKIGFSGGRHFLIQCTEDVSYGTLFSVAATIIESIKQSSQAEKNTLVDTLRPMLEPNGSVFRYYNGLTRSYDDFSIRTWLLKDGMQDTVVNSESRYLLLGFPNILRAAIEGGNTVRIQKLKEYGYDLNQYAFLNFSVNAAWRGFTPLLLAIQCNEPEIVKTLIASGADLNKRSVQFKEIITDLKAKRSPTMIGRVVSPLALANEKGNKEIVELLKSAGAE
ncbi:ankyrin repeat domain-containing protein [bacterium]|nr:ankyrin repeat domain-containing protein [bacterium]